MRFSAAILQIAPREPASLPPLKAAREEPVPRSQEPAGHPVQEPPPDLDQRVRLSGEW